MNDGTFERIYSSQEVCTALNIAASTLRTWCGKLEAHGYVFKRDKVGDDGQPKGNRMFYERDIVALRELKSLLDRGHSMDNAISDISLKYKAATGTVIEMTQAVIEKTDGVIPSAERQWTMDEVMEMFAERLRDELAVERERLKQEIREEFADQIRRHQKFIDVSLTGLRQIAATSASTDTFNEMVKQFEERSQQMVSEVSQEIFDTQQKILITHHRGLASMIQNNIQQDLDKRDEKLLQAIEATRAERHSKKSFIGRLFGR